MSQARNSGFWGVTCGVAAFATAALFAAGCGNMGQAVKPLPVTKGGSAVNPSLIPQNAQGLNAITSFTPQQQAQINAMLGNYTGSFQGEDANGNPITQSYTLTLGIGTSPSVPGQQFVSAQFSAGPMSFTALMQTTYQASSWGASGPTYAFASVEQYVSTIDTDPIVLVVQLTLNSSNQFDPTQSATNNNGEGPIRIVDGVTLTDEVTFNLDFTRH